MRCTGMVVAGMVAFLMVAAARAGEAEEGFKPLFDGKSLDGWVVKGKEIDVKRKMWTVDNGTILADSMKWRGHDYVWLCTKEEYGDFVLRLKFQAYRDNKGNSGIQVRSRYNDVDLWMDGPQIDINPPEPWRTGMMWDETRGNQRWIFPNLPAGKWVDLTMGNPRMRFDYSDQRSGWNEMEVTCKGTKISAVLNGVKITDFEGKGILDDKVHKDRNVGMKGVIALQIHTGDLLRIRYKDISIKELK